MSGMRCTRDLEEHVGRRRTRRRLVRAYDTGSPIDLRYASPPPPAPPPVQAPQPGQPAAPVAPAAPLAPLAPAAPVVPGAPAAPVAAPAAPGMAPAPAAPGSAPAPPAPGMAPAPAAPGMGPAPPAAPVAPAPPVAAPAPPVAAPAPPVPGAAPPAPAPAPPVAAPPEGAPVQRYTAEDDERATAAAFREDLQAILARASSTAEPEVQEDAFIENALSNARTSAPAWEDEDDQEPDQDQQAEGERTAEPLSYAHDIFDQLQFANQFDVGPVKVDLGAKFDDFDRTIVKAETVKAKRTESGLVSPEPIAHMQTVEDLTTLPRSAYAAVVADRMAEAAEEPGPQSFSVVYDVPLVPQQTGMSCWAAGAAMIVAWRDQISVDPSQIAAADGYWAQYANGLLPQDTTIFNTWRLSPEPAQSYTVAGFRTLLERWGPLWTAGAVPGAHIRVVAGIEGDGTPDGTRLHILDPWEPGMPAFKLPNAGGRYTETYAEYERKQATLGQQEQAVQGIYVAHVREPRR